MAIKKLDEIDCKILAIVQEDATTPLSQIAALAGLSQTPCWRRLQRLKKDGVILRTAAILQPEAIGLGLTVMISIEAAAHSPEWLDRFTQFVRGRPEVIEAHRLAGDIDYLLKVTVADMAAYDAFYRELIAGVPIKNVSSRFAMERVKENSAYPVRVGSA